MKVKHLIEKLKSYDPEARILKRNGDSYLEDLNMYEDEAIKTSHGYEFLSEYTNLGEMEDLYLGSDQDHLAFFSVVVFE